MTPEKILELAHETVRLTWINDSPEDLIAFAQSVIEAERESSDEPVLWVEIDDEGSLAWDADKMISDDRGGLDNPIPLYRHPPPARKLTDEARELLEQALKLVAKYHARKTVLVDWEKSVIEAISARLAEDDAKPVCWFDENWYSIDDAFDWTETHSHAIPLYRRPQPKSLLTDEEIEEIHREFPSRIDLFSRAIERKICEKNS